MLHEPLVQIAPENYCSKLKLLIWKKIEKIIASSGVEMETGD